MYFLLPFRFGPRQIRVESALLRSYNSGTRAAPYESLMVADIGDVNVNVYDLKDTCKRIREAYRKILAAGCIPLTMGERVAGAESSAKMSQCFITVKASSVLSVQLLPFKLGMHDISS